MQRLNPLQLHQLHQELPLLQPMLMHVMVLERPHRQALPSTLTLPQLVRLQRMETLLRLRIPLQELLHTLGILVT